MLINLNVDMLFLLLLLNVSQNIFGKYSEVMQ